MEKTKKPRSEAQKASAGRYRDKHRHEYGCIAVNLPISETAESRDIMEKLGIGPAAVWRKAIEILKQEYEQLKKDGQ